MVEAAELEVSLRHAIAADLEMLAAIHDREPDAEMVGVLQSSKFPLCLTLPLDDPEAVVAGQVMAAILDSFGSALSAEDADELAASYADVYLLNGCGCSPYASPWLDKDGLVRQEPMLDVRAWFARHHLRVPDSALRADDHLSMLLLFLAHLIRSGDEKAGDEKTGEVEAAEFLSRYVTNWLPSFAKALVSRHGPPFYAALAVLTSAYTEALAALLPEVEVPVAAPPEPVCAPRDHVHF